MVLNPPTRDWPDYVGSREAAQNLVERLGHYYHKRGYHWVKVWIEPGLTASGRRYFNVRSNLAFKVPQI